MLILIIFGSLIGLSVGQFQGCDYFQMLQPGVSYPIYSPNFPSNYRPGISCRWSATAPAGSTIFINCTTIQIPSTSNGCTIDRLSLSLSGSPTFQDERVFCGSGTLTRFSEANNLVVGLYASQVSPGGKLYCVLSVQTPCQCGRKKQSKIVGGMETSINEYVFHAGLVSNETSSIECGCTLISNRWALTAAHCLQRPAGYGLITGEHDTTTGSETPYTKAYLIQTIKIHLDYNSVTGDYDIALVKTLVDIQFNEAVGPVCLPFRYVGQTLQGAKVEAVGWGTLEFGGPRPNKLQEVTLDVISNGVCQATFPSVTFRQICTYTANKDTCQYDSGGGLFYTPNSFTYIVGITNYGRSCASNSPGVSCRVSEFLVWIQNNTPGVAYCNV